MKKVLVSGLLLLSMLCLAVGSALASSGMVLTVQPGAWVERGGEKIDLAVKAEVLAGDVIVTDAAGRVQVIFSDDTTISLGADTRVAVADFVFDEPGKQASFSANMAKGAARFVTGKVVEQNRNGFSVTTPQATVGIRGTTFAVNIAPTGVTSVVGLKIDPAFPITVTNIQTGAINTIDTSGLAVDASPAGNTSYQAPAGEFSRTGSSVNGSPQLATASTEESGAGQASTGSAAGSSGSTGGTGTTSVGSGNSVASAASTDAAPAAGSSLASGTAGTAVATTVNSEPAAARDLTASAGNSLEDTMDDLGLTNHALPPSGPDHSNASGTYSGAIYQPGDINPTGNFSFETTLNAGSGKITDAQLNITSGYGDGVTAEQRPAESTVSGGNFHIPMEVTAAPGSGVDTAVGNDAYMDGRFTGNNHQVSGTWNVESSTPDGNFYGAGPGKFDGSKQ